MISSGNYTVASSCCGKDVPVELLSRIFSFAIHNPISRDATRSAIGRVCKAWRRTLLNTHSIWSKIDIEFSERWSPEGEVVHPTTTDMSFLREALKLAHPHPLSIRVKCDRTEFSDIGWPHEERDQLRSALTSLFMHSNHWRSFDCSIPGWLFGSLSPLSLLCGDALEHFALRCTGQTNQSPLRSHITQDTHFGSSLRHLEFNFTIPPFATPWSQIQSLTAGFSTLDECLKVLHSANRLTTLFVTHVGNAERTVAGVVLTALCQLDLTPCALAALSTCLRTPNIERFAIRETYGERRHVAHISASHLDFSSECSTGIWGDLSGEQVIKHAVDFLTASQIPRLTALRVSWSAFNSTALIPLLALVGASVETVQLNRGQGLGWHKLLRAFQTAPLLPRLKALHINGFLANNDSIVVDPSLERLISSRAGITGCDKAVEMLREVKIWGPHKWEDCSMEADNALEAERWVSSSLVQTLLKYSRRGLGVEWTVGDIDIMAEARSKEIPRF
ncbi:hypothetical protein CYLTODRAFT_424482 [Cylindrobasidium torrendii FP15055 ss-10]|uniref:F-box domain-containing protein n=1 Tax=Cylindrobasidium torrendii FP15055 ss-10 TaxID=1314674 RepID=A0A0D7B3Y7_9AGAR|nr:hypothetical protein CYLTODRAFT_424482 [Cylindrobasidium torrendii FP15055 ss-10]